MLHYKSEAVIIVEENKNLKKSVEGLTQKIKLLTNRIKEYGVRPPQSAIDYVLQNNQTEASLQRNSMVSKVQEAIRTSIEDSIDRPGYKPTANASTITY
jgi:hypothetical protein